MQKNTYLCGQKRQQNEKANSEFQGYEAILEYSVCDFQGTYQNSEPKEVKLSYTSSSASPHAQPRPCSCSLQSLWALCSSILRCSIPGEMQWVRSYNKSFPPSLQVLGLCPISLVIWGQSIKENKHWRSQLPFSKVLLYRQCKISSPMSMTRACSNSPRNTGSRYTSPRWPFSPRSQVSFPPYICLLLSLFIKGMFHNHLNTVRIWHSACSHASLRFNPSIV